MSTYKKLIDLISRYKAPTPSRTFWEKFDRDLRQRLDALDAGRYQRRFSFMEGIKDVLVLVLQPRFKPAVAMVSLIIIIIGAALLFINYQDVRLYSIAALSDEEVVNELIIIDELVAEVNGAAENGEGINGIFDELRLLYELSPS